jgi:hypothetical protein
VTVEVEVANLGWLATATSHAADVLGIAKPVTARIALTNARLVGGERERALGVLPGHRRGDPEPTSVSWQVQIDDPSRPASAEITVSSEKAGTIRRSLALGDR